MHVAVLIEQVPKAQELSSFRKIVEKYKMSQREQLIKYMWMTEQQKQIKQKPQEFIDMECMFSSNEKEIIGPFGRPGAWSHTASGRAHEERDHLRGRQRVHRHEGQLRGGPRPLSRVGEKTLVTMSPEVQYNSDLCILKESQGVSEVSPLHCMAVLEGPEGRAPGYNTESHSLWNIHYGVFGVLPP